MAKSASKRASKPVHKSNPKWSRIMQDNLKLLNKLKQEEHE